MNINKSRLVTFALVCSLGLGLAACNKTNSAQNDSQSSADIQPNADKSADNSNSSVADAATTAKIKTAILAEPGLKSFQITVTTRDGVVDLTGNVDTQASRDKAQQVAERFSGVKFVENQLVVAPS